MVGPGECPLEKDLFQVSKDEAFGWVVKAAIEERRWQCTNPNRNNFVNKEVFSKCFEKECYFLRRVLKTL